MADEESHGSVSVCVPVFNGMPFLPETIDSIIPQLRGNDELIVVDNASHDGTSAYLRSLTDPRIRVIFRESTQGAAENWTQAIAETRGEFVKLVCGDDLVEPDCLESQRKILQANPSIALVAGKRTVVDQDNRVLLRSHGLNGLSGQVAGSEAIRRCLVAGTNLLGEPAAVMFRGDAIRDSMPWDCRWPYVVDLATYARVAIAGEVVLQNFPVARFRVSSSSWSSQILNQQPTDFRGWRSWQSRQPGTRLSWFESRRSDVNLRLRSLVRRLYFWRVATRTTRSS